MDDAPQDDDKPGEPPAPSTYAMGSASGRPPREKLPPLAVRIEQAREAARQKRRDAGLPDIEPSELEKLWAERWAPSKAGKRKRTKSRGWVKGGSR